MGRRKLVLRMKAATFAFAAALAGMLAGCGKMPDTNALARINGSIHVAAGTPAAAVATVNGSIVADDGATLTTAHTINGGISIGARASAASLSTVNGAVSVGPDAHIAGGITVVNGPITLAAGARVAGAISNVSGAISLSSAQASGGITTVDGDVTVSGASRVEGGITVERPSGTFFHVSDAVPRIVIGPGAVVDGTLRFERKVALYVGDGAKIGPVHGAAPTPFSGQTPPD